MKLAQPPKSGGTCLTAICKAAGREAQDLADQAECEGTAFKLRKDHCSSVPVLRITVKPRD